MLVQELVQEYKKYHLQLLTGSRLEYDYNSLVQDEACLCNAEDIEVHVTRRNGVSKMSKSV